jgi:TonB family protein
VIQRWALICGISAVLIVGGILSAQDSRPFPAPASPGQAIQDAAKTAAHDPTEDRPKGGTIEVLNGMPDLDFRAYLQKVSTAIRSSWYFLVPQKARDRKGNLTIEFAVLPDGKIATMKLVSSSDDDLLDRAAWKAIRAAAPFPALPKEFTRPNLKLRYRFFYNEVP